ncbi:MAG: ThuA domain-containing protein [Gammaproteobacteria bacterium]
MNVLLICGGNYHDFAFARDEILGLLNESENLSVTVSEDYDVAAQLPDTDILITYTCDLVPTEAQQHALSSWLADGKRWFALHGTNSIIRWISYKPLKIGTPDEAPEFMGMLGSQFEAHPPICDFRVEVSAPEHPLVEGIEAFETNDELYMTRMIGEHTSLLHCHFSGSTPEFETTEWDGDVAQPVMYLHPYGEGQVLYLTLGHCRGHDDMKPLMDHYPVVERCSWELPTYYELLRRGIKWSTNLI